MNQNPRHRSRRSRARPGVRAMNAPAVAILASLLFATHAAAAPCPDFAARERSVRELLGYSGAGASLPRAYEQLAESWQCLHPDATSGEFVEWVRGVPSNQQLARNIQAQSFRSGQVLVVWARDDVPDGGRAALYARLDGDWTRQSSIELDRALSPKVVATLVSDRVVILEENRIPRLTTGSVRVLRVQPDRLEQELLEPEVNNARIRQQKSKRLVLEYERIPRTFSTDGLHLRYSLTLAARGESLAVSARSLTPALETLEQFCAQQGTVSSRRYVATSPLISRLPKCAGLHIIDVRRTRSRSWELDVEAPMVCHGADGTRTPLREAVMRVNRTGRLGQISRLAKRGCVRVRARGENEPM